MTESGRNDKAERLLRQALNVCEARAGPDDLATAHFLRVLSVCVRQRGRIAEAKILLTRSTVGPERPSRGVNLHNLGMCAGQQEGDEEAAALLQRSRVIFRATSGPDEVGLAGVLHQLGSCAEGTGQNAEAVEH